MDSDSSDNYEFLYEEGDAPKHDKLVEKVLSLNKTQHLKKPSRTEPTLQISEFNLVKSTTGEADSVELTQLTKSLKNRKTRVKIGKDVEKAVKISHTLPKPLERPQADRIRRTVAYEKTRLQLDRWEPIVTSNRVSTNLVFPLDNDVKLDKKEAESFTEMWRVKSDLERELEKIEPKVEEFHVGLEREKFPLTLKEMMARRKEAAKLRAFQGYKEAKARRQNKIKSKKYHRIQKREAIKQKLKEFELLQKTNPELALEKLEEIEKARAEERFSLRHKGTGKWARNKQIRAKYDKETRQVLAQQLTISRDLTQKLKSKESESEEDEVEENSVVKVDENNPWVNGVKPGKEVIDFIGDYRKYWMEKNQTNERIEANELNESTGQILHVEVEEIKETQNETMEETKERASNAAKRKNKKKKKKNGHNKSQSTSDWEVSIVEETGAVIEEMFDGLENKLQKKMLRNVKRLQNKLKLKFPKKQSIEKQPKKIDLSLPLQSKKPIIDEELIENSNGVLETTETSKDLAALQTILSLETKPKESNIDPNKYIKVKPTNLSTAIPNLSTSDEPTNQREIITEAFEDDDIVQDFAKEKNAEVDKDKPKPIDLSLPGWGSWGGSNIKVNKRKKRRFIIKTPQKIPRRDDNKGSLIINEKAQSKIKEHMVSEVPFPFKTVQDFEATMRAPIGNTFVPETAYRRLIQPAVVTKMGAIIAPISKEVLLNKSG